jgi:hypothetical protein
VVASLFFMMVPIIHNKNQLVIVLRRFS